jgi:uncharacterized protein YxjI
MIRLCEPRKSRTCFSFLREYEVDTSDVLTAAGEVKRVEFEFDFALGIAKSTLAKLPLPIVSPLTQSI